METLINKYYKNEEKIENIKMALDNINNIEVTEARKIRELKD